MSLHTLDTEEFGQAVEERGEGIGFFVGCCVAFCFFVVGVVVACFEVVVIIVVFTAAAALNMNVLGCDGSGVVVVNEWGVIDGGKRSGHHCVDGKVVCCEGGD